MRNKKEKNIFQVGIIIPITGGIICLGGSIGGFIVLYSPIMQDPNCNYLRANIILSIMLIYSLGLIIWSTKIYASKVEITEKGVKRSLFKRFYKKEIAWDEMVEVRIVPIPQGGGWIFFSKVPMYDGISIGKARAKKQIFVFYNERVDELVKQYYKKPIKGKYNNWLNDITKRK